MKHTSDVMQNLAQAFGERTTLEYCVKSLGGLKNQENKKLMATVYRLFACDTVHRDLGFYMVKGVMTPASAKNLESTRLALVKEVAGHTDFLMNSMNIPKHALYAPIAGDYERYNSAPNYGEIVGSKL